MFLYFCQMCLSGFQILQNVSDLNQIVTENQKDIQYVSNGALFQKPSSVCLTFYRDGMKLGDASLRSYTDESSQSFLKGKINQLIVNTV